MEAGDAFPPSRHIPHIAAPTPAPRLTGKIRVLPGGSTGDDVAQAETPQQGRYRVPNRLSAIRKLSVAKEEPSQVIDANDQVKLKPTLRSFRLRPSPFRAANTKAVVDPVDDARYNNDPDQPIQQRSISNQNGRPVNQFSLRKLNNEKIAKEQPQPQQSETSPSKPTRRTFTRKQGLATTTPANVRVTKRYYKKNGSKVETTTTEATVTSSYSPKTPSPNAKPFRVATRHQGQVKQRVAGKTTKKFDDAGGEEDNYPEHFKLLLKTNPKPEGKSAKFRASSPTKAIRVNQRVDVGVEPTEKTVHSALRSNLRTRPRPLLNYNDPKSVVPTTTATIVSSEKYRDVDEQGITEQPSVDYDHEKNDISNEDGKDLISPSRFPDEVQQQQSSREGRRFEENSRNQAAVG